MTEPNAPTDAAKSLRRKVYDALDEAYDEKHKRYRTKLKGEFSDQSVADECGCSVALVAKIRDEFFGPANKAEPVEQIKEIQIKLAHMEREANEMDSLSKGLCKQVKDHRQKISAVKDDLKSLCQAFGWAH